MADKDDKTTNPAQPEGDPTESGISDSERQRRQDAADRYQREQGGQGQG